MNKKYTSEREQQIYDDAMEDFMEKATSILSKYFFDHNYEFVSRFSNLMYGYESEN